MLFKYFLAPIALAVSAVALEDAVIRPDIDFSILNKKLDKVKEPIISFTQREQIGKVVNGWNELLKPISEISEKFSHLERFETKFLPPQAHFFLLFLDDFEAILRVTAQRPAVHQALIRIINEFDKEFDFIVNSFKKYGIDFRSVSSGIHLEIGLWRRLGFKFINKLGI